MELSPNEYIVDIDLKDILASEVPLKYPQDKEKVAEFLKKHPDYDFDNKIKEHEEKNRNQKNSDLKRLAGKHKDCPYINDMIKSIFAISGCEVTLCCHDTTIKPFSTLSGHQKLGTFFFNCKSGGLCGIRCDKHGGITIKVLRNGKAHILYKPQKKTNDEKFKVFHEKWEGINPR